MAKPSAQEVVDLRKTLTDDPVMYLSKLCWEIAEIHLRPLATTAERIFLSLNAAETAWHIHEWLWKVADVRRRNQLLEVAKTKSTGKGDKKDFQAYALGLQRVSPVIAICRQLAIAHKHFSVHHDREDVFFEVRHDADREEHKTTIHIAHRGEVYPDVDVYSAALKEWTKVYVGLGYASAAAVLAALPADFDPYG